MRMQRSGASRHPVRMTCASFGALPLLVVSGLCLVDRPFAEGTSSADHDAPVAAIAPACFSLGTTSLQILVRELVERGLLEACRRCLFRLSISCLRAVLVARLRAVRVARVTYAVRLRSACLRGLVALVPPTEQHAQGPSVADALCKRA